MAAVAALYKEQCAGLNNISPALMRVTLMGSAIAANPADWRYSTPAHGLDHLDGAGAFAAFPGCLSTSGPGTLNLAGGSPGPSGSPPPRTGGGPGSESIASPGLHPLNSVTAPGPGDLRSYYLFNTLNLAAGQRYRFMISWDNCATSANPPYIALPVPDLDIFFYDSVAKSYVYSSQSFYDNSEGWDIEAPTTSTYQTYIAWPTSATACDGSHSVGYAWYSAVWP